tara:strand:+ start:43 stop:528 length:486 start_codon:yes stop_codon:yes gene_type:complete
MSLYNPRASGLGNSAAYQVAGKPYLTGSAIGAESGNKLVPVRDIYKITFQNVTRRVVVKNHSLATDIAVYFSNPAGAPAATTGVHFNIIPANTGSFDASIKCKELFIVAGKEGTMSNPANTEAYAAGAFTVFAELTGVPSSEMYELTGSGINVSTYCDGQN